MLDETRAKTLQDLYLLTRHPLLLSHLRSEIENMSRPLFSIQSKKTGFVLSRERRNELSYEASTRFCEMYLKNPLWYCRSFRNRIYLEVLFFLYSPKFRREPEEELLPNTKMEEKLVEEDDNFVIEDIMSDTPYWRNILINCYKSKSYKSFILSIEPIVGRSWIYDHARRLHKLYKFTRRST